MQTRQNRVLSWAVAMFGPIARNLDERGARTAEEAIEVAQAAGVSRETILRIVERIYSKPPGEVTQEIAGLAMTLDALAELVGVNVADAAEGEYQRVASLPKDHWQKRHAAKVAGGTADLSPAT